MNYLQYLNHPHYLAAFCAVVSGALSFAESKFSKKKYEVKYYVKLMVLVFLNVFVVTWLISNNYLQIGHNVSQSGGKTTQSLATNIMETSTIDPSNYSSVDIGNPNF
jgi:hypothetical protein